MRWILILACMAIQLAWAQEMSQIEEIVGIKGTWYADESVYKITIPRRDVKVIVDQRPLSPFMGLSSWVSFKKIDDSFLAMGDLMLFEDEVNPVMKTILAHGFSVTALHNHFFYDHPKVFFMHIMGKGSEQTLGNALKQSLDQIKEIRTKKRTPASSFEGPVVAYKNAITKRIVDEILGVETQEQEGMVKAVFGRTLQMEETKLGKQMGINSWAAFGGTDEKALVDGDLAVLEDELQSVVTSLQGAGIHIVAIHNHMNHENPRMLFVHYWGKGAVKDLAKAVKETTLVHSQ